MISTNLFAYSISGNDKGQIRPTCLPGTTDADTSSITRSYDTGNRLTQLADSTNGNIGFSYDNLDRVTQMTSPKGSISYTYDANGQRSTMTVAGQPTQSYTYDKVGRLTRIDQAAGAINNNQAQNIQFVYDDAGRLTKTTYANGITRDNSYDDAGQLTGITYKKADNSLIGDLTYTYDANGRRTKTSGSLAKTDLPDTVATTSYDANNRLATWDSQILNYDANGNLTSDGLKTYIWNARNQLIQIKDSTGTEVASFSYDALGRRQAKTINGVSTGFMYDGVNIVQELNGASPINSYISAGVDQVFAQQSGSGSSASSLTYLTDALGSTIRLTNATGDKVVDYSYDPYGNTKADAVINNVFQYTGRENDGTGLYYYRARYYSPATHRFISEDPIGLNGGINIYAYVEGNPLNSIDPFGLEVIFRKDGVEFHGNPMPKGGTNYGEHTTQVNGKTAYHVHINDHPNKRWDVTNNKALDPESNFTKKELTACKNLSQNEQKYLAKAAREVFHHRPERLPKIRARYLTTFGVVFGALMSNSYEEACKSDKLDMLNEACN